MGIGRGWCEYVGVERRCLATTPGSRNGRHTRHTHTPPSSFVASFSFVLPSLSFSFFLLLSFFIFLLPRKGAPYPAHNTYPAPYAPSLSRVRGKFLNFARIENFHILFPWRYGAARCCWLQPVVVPVVLSSCDSCNRTEKFPKATPFHPAYSCIVSR